MLFNALTAAAPLVLLCADPSAHLQADGSSMDKRSVRKVAAPLEHLGATTASHNLRSALNKLPLLPKNWDGHGGVAPAIGAIEEAQLFASRLAPAAFEPAIEPSGDGEINFVWRSHDLYVEVGFDGDGEASYLIKSKDGATTFGEFPASAIPAEVMAAITRSTYAVQSM